MIRVTIEKEPFGFRTNKEVLAEIKIWNNKSGDSENGNYNIECFFPQTEEYLGSLGVVHSRIKGFWPLILSSLRQIDKAWKSERGALKTLSPR